MFAVISVPFHLIVKNWVPTLQVYMIEHDAFERLAKTINIISITSLISMVDWCPARA